MVWRSAATFLAALVFASIAWGQEPGVSHPAPDGAHAPLPAAVPSNRPVVGLALEGGGALGLAHIGVLQWMEENHIPVDRLSGTSMGALIGALYATGTTPADLRALAVDSTISSVFTLQTPYADASYRRRQDRREIPQILSIGLKSRHGLRNALLADRGVNEFLIREFFDYNGQAMDFDQLPIPFRCMATDLNTLQAVSFANGPLTQAVRASISIPGVLPPVQGRNGHYLVDGGILDNLPTGVLRQELHAQAVIAVRLADSPLSGVDTGSIVAVLNRAFAAGIAQNVEQSAALADVVVNVQVSGFSTTDFSKARLLIEAGYKAAEQNRAALMRYALDGPGWEAYLKARDARRHAPPGVLRQVRVEGGELGAIRQVQRDMRPAEGKPPSAQAILSGLRGVQAEGVYGATYEMLAQPATNAAGDTGILVHLRKDPKGPPYLLVGPEVAAATSNISQGELDLRLIDQNLGGYGSELRAGARIGYLTDLSAEYYRLLSPSGYFVQPMTRILREPVYMWANQKRIAERFQQNLEAGIEAGRTVNNHLQISARWSAMDTRWSLRTGSDGGSYLSGTAQTGLLRVTLDESTAGSISPSGFRVSAAAGAFYHAAGSDNAPLVRFSFTQTHPWRQNNIFGIGADLNSYLRARVAEPYRFTLGGPMRLSASSFDEYRGTDTYLARTGYMHRIAPMPTGMGQGLYAILGYEAGEIWSPDAKAILRQDGTTGLVAATPLGVVTFGVSVGDAGRRKVFFTIGRWF